MFSLPTITFPYKLAAAAALLGAVAAGSFYEGHHLATQSEQAAQTKLAQAALAKYQALDQSYQTISQQLQESQNARKVVTQTITKYVDKVVQDPVYHNVCLTPDGLQLANAALAGKAPDSSQPSSTMPAPDTAP